MSATSDRTICLFSSQPSDPLGLQNFGLVIDQSPDRQKIVKGGCAWPVKPTQSVSFVIMMVTVLSTTGHLECLKFPSGLRHMNIPIQM